MTGGLGFSRTGQNTVRQNKDLKTSRSRMKDNPYAVTNNSKRVPAILNYEKLKIWKNFKNEIEKKNRHTIYIVLVTILILFLIIVKMIN